MGDAEKQIMWVFDDNLGVISHMSPLKCMLWALIRIASARLMSIHNIIIFIWRTEKKLSFLKLLEPPRDKTNKMTFAQGEDSDQSGHPPSLIRVFAVCMKKHWVLSYPLSAQQRLIRLGGCAG